MSKIYYLKVKVAISPKIDGPKVKDRVRERVNEMLAKLEKDEIATVHLFQCDIDDKA